MADLRYRIVNVFAESRLGGNPLAVFEDGSGLDTATMQALALQFNLSETTFLLPPTAPDATARVRIFTTTQELPFAGHPTLGTAHVVRQLLGTGDRVVLDMPAGCIPVEAKGDTWTLAANAPAWRPPQATNGDLAAMLGVAPADVLDGALWVDTGTEQLVIPLASADAVTRCRPDPALLERHSVGQKRRGMAYVWAPETAGRLRVRFFVLAHTGLVEDPGTGSACANLGGWFIAHGAAPPLAYEVRQGDQVGRPCRLRLKVDAQKRIFVSGRVVELGRGTITL